MGRSAVVAIGVLVATMVSVSTSVADDTVGDLQRHVDSLRSTIGGEKGVSSHIQRKVQQQTQAIDQALDAAKQPEGVVEESIPRTHVKADGGIPFPKADAVTLEPVPTETPSPPEPEAIVTPIVYKAPARCERDGRRVVPLDAAMVIEPEKIVVDTLYLPEKLVPMDPAEVFGVSVKLLPYGAEFDEGILLFMQGDDVPCVPYRIRMTSKAVYFESGMNALKNYDKDPGGEGVLNAWVQKKVYGVK